MFVKTVLVICLPGETQVETSYIQKTLIDEIVEAVEANEMTLPGISKVKDLDEDELDPVPPAPQLSRLVVDSASQDLILPPALVKMYHLHPVFGKEWGAWMEGFVADPLHKIGEECADADKDKDKKTPGKRPSSGAEDKDIVTPPKRPNLKLRGEIIECSSITEVLLKECKMGVGKDAIQLQIRAPSRVYMINNSLQEWNATMGYVAGFGKGNWKSFAADATLPEKIFMFQLTNSESLVCLNGVVSDLGKVLWDQRKTKPDASICYHKIDVSETDVKKFVCTQTHKIAFVPSEATSDKESVTQNNIGMKLDSKHWDSGLLMVIWAVGGQLKGCSR